MFFPEISNYLFVQWSPMCAHSTFVESYLSYYILYGYQEWIQCNYAKRMFPLYSYCSNICFIKILIHHFVFGENPGAWL